jgi:ATP-binding cassette subfamily C (CFTR/MRP) protein 1
MFNTVVRLAWIIFKYSQPVLINRTIRYVSEPVTEIEGRDMTGYYLILATFIIYVGAGVSFSLIYY